MSNRRRTEEVHSLPMSKRFKKYSDIPEHFLTPSIKKAVVDKFIREFTHTPYRYASAKNYKTYPSEKQWLREGNKIVFTREKWFDHINGTIPKAIHVTHYSDYEWLDQKKNKKSDSFEYKVKTNWFLFDIDIIDSAICEKITIAISRVLNELNLEHHIFYSGGKGTHILVLLKESIPIKACKDFRIYILETYGIQDLYKDAPKPEKGDNNVEIRPYGGWAAKMPLTKHGKTGNFTGPLVIEGETLTEYDGNPYQYFLDMKFSNNPEVIINIFKTEEETRQKAKEEIRKTYEAENRICSIPNQIRNKDAEIRKEKPEKRVISKFQLIREMEEVYEKGVLRKNHQRYATTLALASFLKARGNDDDTTITLLEEWSLLLYENEKDKIDTPLEQHLESIPSIVKRAESWYLPRSPLITSPKKLKKLASMFSAETNLYPFPTLKLAIGLYVYAQNKQNSTQEPFRIAVDYLRGWLKMSPNTIVSAKDHLKDIGLLKELESPVIRNPHKDQDGILGLYQLTFDIEEKNTHVENRIYLNMESLKHKDAAKDLLVLITKDEKDLEILMGGKRHRRRAKVLYQRHK